MAAGLARRITPGQRYRSPSFSQADLALWQQRAELRRRSCGRSLLGLPGSDLALDLPPLHDIAVVLGQTRREGVTARPVGDEVEILGLGRLEHGLDRGATGIADWRRRQAPDLVRVVGVLASELFLRDRVIAHARAAENTVDDGGVRLQTHPLPQPVVEDAGDTRPLLRD